jgi:hypothetical protein
LFSSPSVEQALAALRSDSYADGFVLPKAWLDEFLALAPQFVATDVRSNRSFKLHEVNNARLADGTPVALAFVGGLDQLECVQRLMQDERLLSIAEGYFGYRIRVRRVLLYCSFAGEFSLEDRRQAYQTVEYHFDVDAMNFCYAHFYLTDVDCESGAHVLIKGSHRAKPWRFLLGSARASDQAVETHYGLEKKVVIEGPAGSGFFEDTSCFHKALAPISRDRLMLQLRFSA